MPKLFCLLFVCCLLTACKPDAVLPSKYTPTTEQAAIYPDYRDITIPPNIAPLNIRIEGEGIEYVEHIAGSRKGELIAAAGKDGKIQIDSAEWKQLLIDNKGASLNITIYTHRKEGWLKHPSYSIRVAREPIDPYLSYRLIEPSYELYRQLGIYQRHLETFDETAIYENNDEYDKKNNHCINCHNYQNNSTQRMLFHVRAEHGGTVFADNGKIRRVDMKNDSILGNCVYPAWHPKQPWVAFSSNFTGQAFHITDPQKVEVIDYASDLVFYDMKRNKISNILKTDHTMETFPTWSPDGKRLYYCAAPFPKYDRLPDSLKQNKNVLTDVVLGNYKNVRYNLMSISFDEATRTFGQPELEVDCISIAKSATLPRVSPDGRYLLFTLGDFGQFHIWHKSSDLYVKDLSSGEIRPLTTTNSPDVDSYHSWSSNGRWIVFSSRRDDGSYTRPYIAYFDRQGKGHKAFILPQKDPQHHLLRTKSYNIPELMKEKVTVTPAQFRKVIYDDAGVQKVNYGK